MTWHEHQPTYFGGYQSRVFTRRVNDGQLRLFVGREPLGDNGKLQWHLSCSFHPTAPFPLRLPTWEELKEARYEFCPDEAYMAIIMPPKSEYVNLEETTMHMHEI